jgi:transcriptional regulator with XRE-family HTH domain
MLSFGERIGVLRRRQGMTQRALGEEAGVHHNTIAPMERGRLTDLPGQAIARLASTLGTSTDYLLGLSERDTPPDDTELMETDELGGMPGTLKAPPPKRGRPRKAALVGEEG